MKYLKLVRWELVFTAASVACLLGCLVLLMSIVPPAQLHKRAQSLGRDALAQEIALLPNDDLRIYELLRAESSCQWQLAQTRSVLGRCVCPSSRYPSEEE